MARLDLRRNNRLAMAAVLGLEGYSRRSVDRRLYELLKLRASLLNRCHYCIDMHTTALRKDGESEERISALEDWEPTELFTPRERAVLALTDEVTRLGEHGVSDAVWDGAGEHFSEKELGDLVVAIATINVWNRIGVAGRLEE